MQAVVPHSQQTGELPVRHLKQVAQFTREGLMLQPPSGQSIEGRSILPAEEAGTETCPTGAGATEEAGTEACPTGAFALFCWIATLRSQ